MSERGRRWVRRHRELLRRRRGRRCRACGGDGDLQFAHRHPTGLDGMGRGSMDRVRDITDHPRAYVLLCQRCHRLYDRGLLRPASRRGGRRCEIAAPLPESSGAQLEDAEVPIVTVTEPDEDEEIVGGAYQAALHEHESGG